MRDEKLIFWGFTKKSSFRGGGCHEKPVYRGDALKGGGTWTVRRFKGGGGFARKRWGSVFEEGVVLYPNAHYDIQS